MPEDNRRDQRHRTSSLRLILPLTLLMAVAAAIWHLTREEPASRRMDAVSTESKERPWQKPASVSQAFAGSAVCRECHPRVWEAYQTHSMARSLSRVEDAGQLEDYGDQTQFSRGNRDYRVERSAEKVVHHESQRDSAGELIYDQGLEVRYAIGSGKRGRSYLIERDGILFASPISWYSQVGRWDLSPGYQADAHQRFERRIVERCIACHSGRAIPDSDWADRFEQPPFVEFGIGCERCHGPAAGHVTRHRSIATPMGDDPIVNPAKLDPALRESVCYQCHLHGVDEILRYGRTDFDFRPGMHVGDVWTVIAGEGDPQSSESAEAVSQVHQMRSSRCSSDGRLGCISCHDPHALPAAAERDEFYRQKCLACHAVNDCAETREIRRQLPHSDSCIACHMPRLSATDVPHVAQTDHRVLRQPGKLVARSRNQKRDFMVDGITLFEDGGAPLAPRELARVRGIVLARTAERRRNRGLAQRAVLLLEPTVRACPDDRLSADALAIAQLLCGRSDAGISTWRRLLIVRPLDESTLQSLALTFERQGDPGQALEYVDRLIAVNRWSAPYASDQSRLLKLLNRPREALDAARRAVELNPSQPDAYRFLAELCRQQGLPDEANQALRTAARLKQP